MVTVRQLQRIWEVHEYELTDAEYKRFKKLPKSVKPEFLDSIGGTPAEYESDEYFVYEIVT